MLNKIVMPVLRFRVYWEEEESIYRDLLITSGQTFLELHQAILQSYEFDNKHNATFYRSNDHWQRGREIILRPDDQVRKAPPLLMAETPVGSIIRNPNEKFVYVYDFIKHWTFLVELIAITREQNNAADYPVCVRKEGVAPGQYGKKGRIVKDDLMETEEKYDLNDENKDDGYSEEGESNREDEGESF